MVSWMLYTKGEAMKKEENKEREEILKLIDKAKVEGKDIKSMRRSHTKVFLN